MNKTVIRAVLTDGRIRIQMDGSGQHTNTAYWIAGKQVKGYWSTPSIKNSLTEAQTRNGSHGVSHKLLYASRVVTIPFGIRAKNRGELEWYKSNLGMLLGSPDVRFEVYDGERSTYVTGMISIDYASDTDERTTHGEITMTCIDAERKSVITYRTTISMGGLWASSGGLRYGSNNAGLLYPLDYGVKLNGTTVNNCTVHNYGNYEADLRFVVTGEFNGFRMVLKDSRGHTSELLYDGFISRYNRMLLDSKTGAATIDGSDMSTGLRKRGFLKIPANGDVDVTLLFTPEGSPGNGIVSVEYNNTWL